jgi:hypothetical protein
MALRGLVRGAGGQGGVTERNFGFRGILTANKRSKFRVSELGAVLPGQSGRNGRAGGGLARTVIPADAPE